MKWHKIVLLFCIFLAFLGIGTILSNVQAREADQLLAAHGLGNKTRSFNTKRKVKINSFLVSINRYDKHHQVQLHLINKDHPNQVLAWTNRHLITLPMESGRFFNPEDFTGQVSFAILGPKSKVKTLTVQNNKYVQLDQRYYSVIGQLRNYRQYEANKYYLTTGVEQPTAKRNLNNYHVLIDASNRVIRSLAKHYHATIEIPAFVRAHQIRPFSVITEIAEILFLEIIAMGGSAILTILVWHQMKLTQLHGHLLQNWLSNQALRLFLSEIALTVVAYFFLVWRAFYTKINHLLLALIVSLILILGTHLIFWFVLNRKEANHD